MTEKPEFPKFRVFFAVDEFFDTGDQIQTHTQGSYQENCLNWQEAKKTITHFTNRIGKKLK